MIIDEFRIDIRISRNFKEIERLGFNIPVGDHDCLRSIELDPSIWDALSHRDLEKESQYLAERDRLAKYISGSLTKAILKAMGDKDVTRGYSEKRKGE